jgi:hypothetical protein
LESVVLKDLVAEKAPGNEHRKFIIIVELDPSMPQRIPQKPHLYIGLTVEWPEKRFNRVMSGKISPIYAEHYKCLRPDLSVFSEVGLPPEDAKRILAQEKLRLTREGFAINGDSSVWHTYVVDLDPTGEPDVGQGFVYVGQTSLTPEARFAVHKGGKPKAPAVDLRAGVVAEKGLQLNYELMTQLTPLSPVFTLKDALVLEKTLALKLHELGYRVEAGDATPGRASKKKSQ